MGIEEAILQEVEEKGIEKGTLQTKTKAIKKALQQRALTVQQIVDVFDVPTEFVLKVQRDNL